jgi:hypothetical protein
VLLRRISCAARKGGAAGRLRGGGRGQQISLGVAHSRGRGSLSKIKKRDLCKRQLHVSGPWACLRYVVVIFRALPGLGCFSVYLFLHPSMTMAHCIKFQVPQLAKKKYSAVLLDELGRTE